MTGSTSLRIPKMLESGTIVGGIYQVVHEIGHGGTGVVYLAYHLNLQKYIVLKRITRQIHSMESLRREADILKNLRHTNIPQIYDFVIEDGEVFTVMDYIEGNPLDQYIGGAVRYSEEQLIRWFRELTDVLVYLGSRHPAVIHSDIKPGNIIITPQGSPVLIDFNISIDLSAAGRIAGFSRNYASPEQGHIFNEIVGGMPPSMHIDTRTDIYSLGAVFYTLITGITPDCRYVLARLEDMQGLPYSQAFLAVIDRCIEWDRNARFRNAAKLSAAVTNLYKMDRNYRTYAVLRVASWIVSAAVFAGGCFCVLHGIQINNTEKAELLFSGAAASAQAGDFVSAGKAAEEILDNPLYSRHMDSLRLAGLYRLLGDSEYVAEDYSAAAHNYREAIEMLGDTKGDEMASCRSDLALAYFRNGDTDELISLAEECEKEDSGSSDVMLIRAMAMALSGDADGCRASAEKIIGGDSSAEVKTKACIIAAQCCSEMQIDKKLKYMRQAAEYTDEMKYIRECAELEYKYASRPGISEYERKAGGERAAKLYTRLCSVPSPQLIDRINLGISYYYAGQYDKSLSVMTAAAALSDDYPINMYRALAAERLGDIDSAKSYCADALNACKKSGWQGWEEDYQTLQELSDRLY